MVTQAWPWKEVHCSDRDMEVYRRSVVDGKSQRAIAAEFKISQPRVAKIIAKVRRWLAETAPAGFDEVPRNQRLYEVSRTHRMRLDGLYRKAMEAYDMSLDNQRAVKEKVTNDHVKGTTSSTRETLVKSPKPNTRALLDAAKLSEMLVKFEGFDPRGSVDPGNDGRMREEPEVTSEEAWLELGRRVRMWERATGRGGDERESGGGGGGEGEKKANANACAAERERACAESVSCTANQVARETEVGADQRGLSRGEGLSQTSAASEQSCDVATVAAEGLSALSGYQPTPAENAAATLAAVTIIAAKIATAKISAAPIEVATPPAKRIGERQPGPQIYDAKLLRHFPPAPFGYHRTGDRCWPIPYQQIRDPLPHGRRREPPPRYFEFDDRVQDWVPR